MVCKQSLVCLLLFIAHLRAQDYWTDPTVVAIDDGTIQGIEEKSLEGKTFYSFMGIPFAKPPVGELRFRNPVPAEAWKGVLNASTMPPECPQYSMLELPRGLDATQTGQEDCLYLNVFTPKPKDLEAKLPVMVFIHGGAFFCGGAELYHPHVFLNKDVVLVVPQYRLGILGFLSTEDSVIPGNYGMRDQVLALEWVKKNIRHFGGDSGLVTIFGESAGGGSVSHHLLSPLSKGLFQRAIAQSGSSLSPWAVTTDSKTYAKEVGISVGCSLENGSEEFLLCMQKADMRKLTEQLVTTLRWGVGPLYNVPRVDGEFLPDHPANLLSKGMLHDVDYMSGVTRDEGAFVTLIFLQYEHLMEDLESRFEEVMPYVLMLHNEKDPQFIARRIKDHYYSGKLVNRESGDIMTAIVGDFSLIVGHDFTSMYVSQHQKKGHMYLYEFTYQGDFSFTDFFPGFPEGQKWVSHIDDLIYLFQGGKLFGRNVTSKDDLTMRKMMVDLWTNFASSGDPTPDNSLGFKWMPASVDSFKHLELKLYPSMEVNQRKKLRDFWTSLDLHIVEILKSHNNFEDLLGRLNSDDAKDEL